MSLVCLDNLVGLSDRECSCFETDRPEGFNESSSGYYLTDTEGGFPLLDAVFSNLNCNEATIWDTLEKSRSNAIRDFKTNLRTALYALRDKYIVSRNEMVAKAQGQKANITGHNYVGLRLSPFRLKHASFVINAIYIGIDTTKNVDVVISSNNPDFTEQTVSISAQANKFVKHTLQTPIVLPMYEISVPELKYNVRFEPDGALPLMNKIFCCGARPTWTKSFEAGGLVLDDITDEFDGDPTANTGYGMAIEGHMDCADLDWICELEELNGYVVDDVAARCIQFKGAMHLITAILDSDKPNRYTLLKRESLYRKYGTLKKNYENYINWLAENVPLDATSCWGCKKDNPAVANIPA